MNKYQKALDNLKTMGDKDLYNERNIEWCNILQELVDFYDNYCKNCEQRIKESNENE